MWYMHASMLVQVVAQILNVNVFYLKLKMFHQNHFATQLYNDTCLAIIYLQEPKVRMKFQNYSQLKRAAAKKIGNPVTELMQSFLQRI